jgi:NitT/TauT family transport system substrate-binding protein
VRTLENLALQVPFLRLRARNTLAPLVGRVELSGVRNPDEIRAALTSGSADVITLPTNVAATLANRGIDVRLLGVVQASLLRIVGPPGARFDWRELRGQPVAIPFRGDAPDLIFRSLAGRNGLDPDRDVTITNYPQIPEVVSALVSGRARYAVLPEPQATLAVTQGAAAGLALGPRLSLTGAWRRATGDTLPQAGVAVRGEIARRYPAVVAALQRELDATTRAYSADPIAAGRRLAPLTGLPEQGAATIVARLRPDYVPARTVQRQVERYFQVLARATPDAIGGRLPDRSFYVPPAR